MVDASVNEAAFDFEIEREFGLSHRDFFRIFPRIEPGWVRLGPLRVAVSRDDGRRLEIEISPEHVRNLATLRIPYVLLQFRFAGWSEEQRSEFFKNFDRSFQKGGG